MIFVLSAFAASVSVAPGDDLQALSSSLGPGDLMVFQDGVYELEGQLSITATGEEGNHVQIVAQEGTTPILRAIAGSSVFELRDAQFVTVRGLTFEGGELWETEGGRGVTLRNASNVVFEDNIVRNTRQSLLVLDGDGSLVTVRRNHLHHSSDGHGLYAGCGDGSCWLSEAVIEQNLIHDYGIGDNLRYGIVLDNGSQGNRVADNVLHTAGHGIRVESTQLGDPNFVEGNAVFDGLGDGIQVTGAARVRNNVVFQMGGVGIASSNHENDDLSDAVISYNTVALTTGWAVRLDDWANRDGMVFSSNAIANITGRGFLYDSDEEDTTNYVTNNVISGLVEGVDITLYPDWYVPGAGTADFADVEAWDFYPVSASELVGAADPAGEAWIPDTDFNGADRNGANPTVGAYEWDGGNENPGWLIATGFKELGTSSGPGSTEIPKGGCCKGKSDGTEAMIFLPLLAFGLRRRR